MPPKAIVVRGARQNNLKGFDLRLPVDRFTVVTGVSGSGKSSLAFETLYAEGQRRYSETFSPYIRQFLDRMDKPNVDAIESIPPAIAIDQTNPVRTSRSTVGTMTEINDYLKLLWAREAVLHCRSCNRPVTRDTPEAIVIRLLDEANGRDTLITFDVDVPKSLGRTTVAEALIKQGFTRVLVSGEVVKLDEHPDALTEGRRATVVHDRVRISPSRRARLVESLESAMHFGRNKLSVVLGDEHVLRFSAALHCAECDIAYEDPVPNLFSFNSPIGACPTCRGFGRTIEIDPALVFPDPSLSVTEGVIKPWEGKAFRMGYRDTIKFCRRRGIPVDVPWKQLSDEHRRMIWEGTEDFYGVKGLFDWLETKTYKMHVRVYLSKFRTYRTCRTCGGRRLNDTALLYRLDGRTLPDVWQMPVERSRELFAALRRRFAHDEATALLVNEIGTRLDYLVDVGLGYLTLDRQSRTLSGGEVERVGLTTALGSRLVNTLYVLDEPSIGLHARDVDRLVGVLHRITDAGNTVVVVEHDPGVIRAADNVVDLGPGPGERGGRVVFHGPVEKLSKATRSLTGKYLSGAKEVALPAVRRNVNGAKQLVIRGAGAHNLKNIDVAIPLERFVCITGVSGSGKSTLVEDIVYRGLARLQGRSLDEPGAHTRIEGHEYVGEVILVDQAPIGRTPRAVPATYMGAYGRIREMLAATSEARRRGFGPGAFSFNVAGGRCETCKGAGFQTIEMQFLSDVHVTCPDCEGRRFTPELLDIRLDSKNINDILAMTVTEAIAFFEDSRISTALQPLVGVGLGYLRLGQPITTLSGGEAQRLKLAARLNTEQSKHSLFLFDEPTTGLHADDVATLMTTLQNLVRHGHSVVVIEHNLDVIKCADWVVDLGPEGGEHGGEIVVAGAPEDVARCDASHTGRYLKAVLSEKRLPIKEGSRRAVRPSRNGGIEITGAREHNLRDLDVSVPRDRIVAITGVSGSGKSTLAYDVLFAEGQRRYLDCLSAYVRQYIEQLTRPDVDRIDGIPPTVAVEQRLSRGGVKSTVATITEIYHYLRLLFARFGTQYCPECDVAVEPQSPRAIVRRILDEYGGRRVTLLAPLIRARKGFHTDVGRWARQHGIGFLRVDGDRFPTHETLRLSRYREHNIDGIVGQVKATTDERSTLQRLVEQALEHGDGMLLVSSGRRGDQIYSTKRTCPRCGRGFEELDPRLFSYNSRHGWCAECEGAGVVLYAEKGGEAWDTCEVCAGRRLNPTALAVRLGTRSIAEIAALPVERVDATLVKLRFAGHRDTIARGLMDEIRTRLEFLTLVGLPYLGLDRGAGTLSGGEAQRVRLAAQAGSNLRGVCYVLDEPTIGLHPRDTGRLIKVLRRLRDRGNTVIVVEHDDRVIRSADHVIDLGPGAGRHGGAVVASGPVRAVTGAQHSATARYLRHALRHTLRPSASSGNGAALRVVGARANNLKTLDVRFPLGTLICVTGVSGSGKSSLVQDVLFEGLRRMHAGKRVDDGLCTRIEGAEQVARVLEVDQTPIGRTPRSTPATYVGFFDEIRRLFAMTPEARVHGYTASRFSFNVKGGRCEKCLGQGRLTVEMSFLPNVHVECDVCGGRRFNAETLAITFKGKSIADVLAMTAEEAAVFFGDLPRIGRPIELLCEIGLGYVALGQTSATLSGGESQRIKLAYELAKPRLGRGRTLYVLDEPTIGLHPADIASLLAVLRRFVERGDTIVVIEHNLDVIAEADHVIDLGPEGGEDGGRIVFEGPPADLVKNAKRSYTARFLREHLDSARSAISAVKKSKAGRRAR
ncbi:MAG: excinuclease ABC subunit UvrA [Verrucomicrobia bacterium]|nr:excinuclease ABC subunit UvrA [Verrucomicrobiota bacterium]